MIAQHPGTAASNAAAARYSIAPRPGYDATPSIAEARIRAMLRDEAIVWLSTVRRDGLPSLVPTWFWWDGEAIVVFSKPEAAKVSNLRANPRLMVAIGDPEEDFSVGLVEAEALVCRDFVVVPAAFFAKYRDRLAEAGLDPTTFRATYTQALRIVPVRFLSWHGRGSRHEAAATVSEGAAPTSMVARVRNLLGAARSRIANRPGPSFPRRAAPGIAVAPAAAPTGAIGRTTRNSPSAPQLPAWA